jgi:RNA polymerase sigma-70 factor (ECF subfamily)
MEATPTPIDTLQKTAVVARHAKAEELDDVLARYLPRFYRFALRHLRNAADAEDAVQDAVLSAYRHLAQFRQEAQMSTWLAAIVLNCARLQLRRRLRVTFVPLDYSSGDEKAPTPSERLVDERPSPEDLCDAAEMKEHLNRMITRLSPPLLRTFQLRHVDGFSIRETADILKVPEGTVKARLARARCILLRHMRTRFDPPSYSAIRRA